MPEAQQGDAQNPGFQPDALTMEALTLDDIERGFDDFDDDNDEPEDEFDDDEDDDLDSDDWL